jgi:hypothetical protein
MPNDIETIPAPAPAATAIVNLVADLETKLAPLDAAARKDYFHKNKTADDVKALNALCAKVDSIRVPAERKAFFLAHPELEIRYSANNFVKPA